jgi:outer membrane protein TolC
MKKYILSILFLCCFTTIFGQGNSKSLDYYLTTAKTNSPLLKDYSNQKNIQEFERQRLKAFYTHSRTELGGNYLFVPVISKNGGFKWNSQDTNDDYYGYDLSVSSGQLQAGVTWTQPLLGKSAYTTASEQTKVNTDILNNNMRLEIHQLERTVTEQYILCLLDCKQLAFTDSVNNILQQQENIVRRLASNGMAKQTDLHLIAIEKSSNEEQAAACRQSYNEHFADLNILCGNRDTTGNIALQPLSVQRSMPSVQNTSAFMEQYRLDSLNALASLHSYNIQYKPQLNFFVDGGFRSSLFKSMQQRLGMSAGLTFSWTLSDGKQRQSKEKQMLEQMNSIQNYRQNFKLQNEMRIHKYLNELKIYDTRLSSLNNQREEYIRLLNDYRKEMQEGQRSVIDYVMVLRNRIQTEKDLLLLQTNRQLLITAFNYWNW